MNHAETTVVYGGRVHRRPGLDPPIRGDLVIEDGTVVAIESPFSGHADVEVDAENCIVLPGFVNAHVHPGATPMLRGLAEDSDLAAGAAFYHATTPVRQHGFDVLEPDEYGDILLWDAVAMLLGGATMLVNECFGSPDGWIDVVERLGFRSSIGLTYPANVGAIGYMRDGHVVRDEAKDIEETFGRALALHDVLDGAFDGRLRVHLSPHASDTVPEELLRATRREADARGTSIHLHLAQHLEEERVIRDRTGLSPVAYTESIGLLGPDVLATHLTYTDSADWDILARTQTTLVHCPYRKAKEGLTSPFNELLERAGDVAFATDSFSHDLVTDLRFGAVLGKIRGARVGRPTAADLVRCVTGGAARVLGQPKLGSLLDGAPGDVTVVDVTSPFAAPVLDDLRAVVYYTESAAVRHTLVAGRPLVTDRRLPGIDLDALGCRVADACGRVWASARERGLLGEAMSAV